MKRTKFSVAVHLNREVSFQVKRYFKKHPGELNRVVAQVVTTRADQLCRVKKALRYMREHCCGEEICEHDVAEYVGWNTRTFSTLFHKFVGETYVAHLTKLRVAAAKKLLRHDGLVTEVARQVGFGTINGFSSAFKRTIGQNPCAYRIRSVAKRNGHAQ